MKGNLQKILLTGVFLFIGGCSGFGEESGSYLSRKSGPIIENKKYVGLISNKIDNLVENAGDDILKLQKATSHYLDIGNLPKAEECAKRILDLDVGIGIKVFDSLEQYKTN